MAGAGAWLLRLACVLVLPPSAQAIERMTLGIGDIRHPALVAEGIAFHFDAAQARADLEIRRLVLGGREWRTLSVVCPQAELGSEGGACVGGQVRVAGRRLPLAANLHFDARSGAARVELVQRGGARIDVRVDADGRLHARVVGLPLAESGRWLSAWRPGLRSSLTELRPTGVLDGELDWLPAAGRGLGSGALRFAGKLREGGFATADGLQAAERLAVEFAVEARPDAQGWAWTGRLDWREGAAYLHPLYVDAGPALQATGQLHDGLLRVEQAKLALEGVTQLAASALIDLRGAMLVSAGLAASGLDLAVVGPRWLAPLIAPASVERLRFDGRMSAGVRIEGGRLAAVDVAFDEAGFKLLGATGGGGVALGPVSGHLPWQRGVPARGELRLGGGRWEKLSLGAFELGVMLGDEALAFERTVIPLLDGALVFDGLSLRRDRVGWVGSGGVVVEPVSMEGLTAALGLPTMRGRLSAALPGLRIRPGEVALDGALVISVFDGYLQATGLRVREPFGVASHLTVDVEGRHIDLAQLTDAFSFGSITGYADLDLHGLELVRWRPVGFDARIASSPGRYPRRISQRAVRNISALGGAGALAAIQRSLLGLFDTFGYRELGFRCVLDGGVCLMGGIEGRERADGGFVMVRGGGVPALDVIGYNRRVDWDELVDRLQRVIEGNVAPEVR